MIEGKPDFTYFAVGFCDAAKCDGSVNSQHDAESANDSESEGELAGNWKIAKPLHA